MAKLPTIIWTGKSGKQYRYWIHRLPPNFKADSANYIFAKETPNTWVAVYVGETSDLSERFDNHHAMPCIKRNGATHIHVHTTPGGAQRRRDEEADLITQWNPTCNG